MRVLLFFCPLLFIDSVYNIHCYNDNKHAILCNDMARRIWEWCITRQICLTIGHIPGGLNDIGDTPSRVFDVSTEWKLDVALLSSAKH